MIIAAKSLTKTALLAAVSALVAFSGSSVANQLSLPDVPLYLPESVPPLNMLVLGRDHKLYYEAYNDYTDLNDDGVLDVGYKGFELKSPAPAAPASPYKIDYYGYFDSFKCYTYDSGNKRFNPSGAAGTGKTCSGAWSGDFLNYLTTSRIDALRKVLYGGYRSTDTATETVLERSFIPQDAHSWGKEYTSVAHDGYDISKYAPLTLPTSGNRHLFANTTLLNTAEPLLRILQNRTERIWNWVSIERPVAGSDVLDAAGNRQNVGGSITDYSVRVKVCAVDTDEGCQKYPSGSIKPYGLLQEYGANDSMYFGLISGSYAKNTSGGVLRREISSISDEIDPDTGIFYPGVKNGASVTANQGIITTLNRLKTTGFGNSYQYDCGWSSAARTMNPGECQMWGNPIGEMMYESLRYFAGAGAATPAFSVAYGQGEEANLAGGGLPVASWDNPYASPRPYCAKPFQTVISDINPSYDTDEVPGSAFASVAEDPILPGMMVSDLGQSIWNGEFNGATKSIFIGDVNNVTDGAPTAKAASSFGNIRGLSPEEPTKRGGYTAAAVAYYGHKTDLNENAKGEQKVSTFSVALASPLPKIAIPVNGQTITLVPFAKSVNGSGIDVNSSFQPTDQIVDFYVDTLTPTSGRFRVNFEDVEQGADHDMDAIAVYDYQVVGNTVEVTVTSEYAYGGITQHMGYVISGTSKDGIYLEVRDRLDGEGGNDVDFQLDTPPTFTGTPPAAASASGWKDGVTLPFVHTRSFSAGTSTGAEILKDPLWYAAKWGGYDESKSDAADKNDIPNQVDEWDTDHNGTPDNYFLVTNALKLSAQLRSAFDKAKGSNSSASSAAVNTGSISSDTRIFQAKFIPGAWGGQVLAYALDVDTGSLGTRLWDASEKLPLAGARNIVTLNSDNKTKTDFVWSDLDAGRKALLGSQDVLNYLRGDTSKEVDEGGTFRIRQPNPDPVGNNVKNRLGDIVSSSPLFVGAPPFRYKDSLSTGSEQKYSQFVATYGSRQHMVYAGGNDGMLHGFDAQSGVETFAFIPSAVFPRLKDLASTSYGHEYYVDGPTSMGDVVVSNNWRTVLAGGLNKGGQEIYALDITDPSALGKNSLMWEFRDFDVDPADGIVNGDSDLGLTYSQPSIVKLRNGTWAAVFGNGYNSRRPDGNASTTGNAVLYVVDIANGNLLAKLDTGVGLAQAPSGVDYDNGLSTPALVDLNNDRVVEYAFAGDLYGNMWKFDLSSTNPSDWNVAFGNKPLITAKDSAGNTQPITDRPEVARGPAGQGMVVLFGTGKYLEPADKIILPQRVQSFYGVIDKNLASNSDYPTDRSKLIQQTIKAEVAFSASVSVRVTSDNPVEDKLGWYLDLVSPNGYEGERVVSNPIVRNGNVIFTTLIPSRDPCEAGGKSWLMEMKVLDGGRLDSPPFDLNNDGKFDDQDTVKVKDPITNQEISYPVSGIGSSEGILQTPGVADGTLQIPGETGPGHPVQFKYLPGSTGNIQKITENPGKGGIGRQSWRQVR